MLIFFAAALAAPVFTGDAAADFDIEGAVVVHDANGIDASMPSIFPSSQISGNDMRSLYLFYDTITDTLHVGLDTYGIAGDVDGDGNPNDAGPDLLQLGGLDEPDFEGTESFALMLDLNRDGITDLIVGTSAHTSIADFGAYGFSGNSIAPSLAFGGPLPAQTGSLHTPILADLEFTVPNLSQHPSFVGTTIAVTAFQGSLSDAGIGEDFLPNIGSAATVDLIPPVLTLTGTCPGATQLEVTGLRPLERVLLVGARQQGTLSIPYGRCTGTSTRLDRTASILVDTTADASGTWSQTFTLPAGACGRTVQALGFNSCETTNTARP